jgi:zinc protease
MRPVHLGRLLAVACLFLLPRGTNASEVETHTGFFPYPVHREVLPNGLHVLAIPMPEFQDVLSYNVMVLAGARNETVKGQSGLAHLFEHLMFRHMYGGEVNGYDAAIGALGAFNNAWTWFDVTYYHPVTFAQNLDRLHALEVSRFRELEFTEKIFKTEAGAVMGEYRNNAASPNLRLSEVVLAAMYGDYGYGHTAMGYLEDVADMPNEYEAANKFYTDFYRPNNVLFVVSGDVTAEGVFTRAREGYGTWEPADLPDPGEAPPVDGPKHEHVDWPVEVPPRVQLCFRMPPHATGSVPTAVGQLLPELLASETAPLYQLLRSQKKTASSLSLGRQQYESFGPGPFRLEAVLFQDQYTARGRELLDEALADMLAAVEELKNFSQRTDAQELLDTLASKYQYDLLSGLDSPARAAAAFSWHYRFERDLQVFDKLVASVQALTPADVDRFARTYFVDTNRVVVTLTGGADGARQE